VVWNLLSNAIKFTPGNGKVTVELRRWDGHVDIVVTDTGAGIPRDFLPHVFDRFRQADSSAARVQGGLGLGLAIVRHLVEVHGGTVRAESEGEGKGARFTVRMPARRAHATREEPASRTEPATEADASQDASLSLAGARILVVDDDADARDLVHALLASYGADVDTVASADEAVARIEREAPDVLVSDIGLPNEDGYSLIRRVRAIPGASDLPAVALTAYAGTADNRRALEAGFQRHVAKPVEPTELAAVIAAMVCETRSRAANGSRRGGDGPPLSLVASNG
jgi:CheY-like chemotaxis protein/anti-sigma regulatory factor (Ser/Thr protein kinase)